MTAVDEHPDWCDGRERPGAPHLAMVGGAIAVYVDLCQHGHQPACVALGVYTRRRSSTCLLTVDQAIALRDAL
jgi:hypothetical protein